MFVHIKRLHAVLPFSTGNKYWSGLLRDYYGPRAAIYFKYLRESLEKGEDFNLKEWRREWIKLTNDWQSRRNIFPVVSRGDALNTSRWLFNKYLNLSNPETLESWSERLPVKFQ
jgi:alpha-N-acetylglucosaminidase